jgi:hypothetical protein
VFCLASTASAELITKPISSSYDLGAAGWTIKYLGVNGTTTGNDAVEAVAWKNGTYQVVDGNNAITPGIWGDDDYITVDKGFSGGTYVGAGPTGYYQYSYAFDLTGVNVDGLEYFYLQLDKFIADNRLTEISINSNLVYEVSTDFYDAEGNALRTAISFTSLKDGDDIVDFGLTSDGNNTLTFTVFNGTSSNGKPFNPTGISLQGIFGFAETEQEIDPDPEPATPEPATMLIFGLGIVGLGLARRRMSK